MKNLLIKKIEFHQLPCKLHIIITRLRVQILDIYNWKNRNSVLLIYFYWIFRLQNIPVVFWWTIWLILILLFKINVGNKSKESLREKSFTTLNKRKFFYIQNVQLTPNLNINGIISDVHWKKHCLVGLTVKSQIIHVLLVHRLLNFFLPQCLISQS